MMKVYELIRRLRKMPRNKDVKMFNCSGYFDDDKVAEVVSIVDDHNPNNVVCVGLFTAKRYALCVNNGED